MKEVLTISLLLLGAAFIVLAAIGAVRLPDVLCRSHAVAKASTLGIFSMLLGLWTHLGDQSVGLKVLLAILFQGVTIPVAAHLVSLLAWRAGTAWRGPAAPEEAPSPTRDQRETP